MKIGALAACSGNADEKAVTSISEMQVQVHNSDGVKTFDARFGFNKASEQLVTDVPEGPNERVTILGYSGGGEPSWFARRKRLLVQKGADNAVEVVLSRFGGFSCPSGDTEYTHRMFPTVTDLGGGKFFIAGGLTSLDAGAGSQTHITTSESSRKAFIYDSAKGTLSRAGSSLMASPRGGHSAVLVESADKSRVVIFGGTSTLIHHPGAANGFAWSYDTSAAISTVEVFEWEAGTDPANGAFVNFDTQAPQMLKKRVFPMANVISTDGLVLVCGGGQWGVSPKPEGYQECDVWDTLDLNFLPDLLSNNFMAQYRTGSSAVAFQQGEVTRLLVVGGVTEGPIAEVYTSSTAQRDGVGGSFINTDIPGPPHSFFQSLTKLRDNEFVMIGGVNWNGQGFDAPSADHAWRLKLEDLGGGNFQVIPEGISGLGVGRYFHTAAAPDANSLVVVGGFVDNDFTATSDIRFLDSAGLIIPPDSEGAFSGRGGMGSALLDNDTVLIVGGVNAAQDLSGAEFGALEVYTPSNLGPF